MYLGAYIIIVTSTYTAIQFIQFTVSTDVIQAKYLYFLINIRGICKKCNTIFPNYLDRQKIVFFRKPKNQYNT